MKRYFILPLVMMMAACSKSETPMPLDDGTMRFEVIHPSTRVTETAFEEGDKMGLYVTDYVGEVAPPLQISGNWANNVAATLTNGVWNTEKPVYWSDNKMDVYAYYPYMEPTSIELHPFQIALDQSIEGAEGEMGGYEASDFLWAKAAGVTSAEGAVALEFRHRMSKFVIKLVKGPDYKGDLPENAEVFIHSVVPTANIDFTTGTVVKDMFGEMATVKCRKVDNGTYEAIMVPQRLESRRPFVELIANGVSYLLEDTFYFRAGRQHTLSLTINSNPDQVKVEIGGEIEGEWN